MPKPAPLVVFTDGACLGNPGPGGWAWAAPDGPFASGAEARTTNQRMEITAAYQALLHNGSSDEPVEVVSDSTYVVNCFRDRWWEGWRKRGWINSQRKPVANRELWEPLVELVEARGNVTFRWVKGHSGDPMNDLVDRLAVEAAYTQQGRAGAEPPTDIGPPDKTGRAGRVGGGRAVPSAAGARSGGPTAVGGKTIEGHGLVVFGPKPPELGGYEPNAIADAVRARLGEIFAAKARLHDDLVVVTGLRLGAETLAAEAAIAAEVPYVVVLPYPDPQTAWPRPAQEHFIRLRDEARDVILLQKHAPDSKPKAAAALRRRDAWLARNAAEAILVWDEHDELLGKLHRSLEDHLGDNVWIVRPTELAP